MPPTGSIGMQFLLRYRFVPNFLGLSQINGGYPSTAYCLVLYSQPKFIYIYIFIPMCIYIYIHSCIYSKTSPTNRLHRSTTPSINRCIYMCVPNERLYYYSNSIKPTTSLNDHLYKLYFVTWRVDLERLYCIYICIYSCSKNCYLVYLGC